MRRLLLFALTLTVIATSAQVHAESIWARRSRRHAFLFEDNFARHIGDTLIIAVAETTAINNSDIRDMAKATDTRARLNFDSALARQAANALTMDGRTRSDRSFESDATFTSSRQFTTRMSVTVTDVLPNGNLVVEGYRRYTVQGERRTMRMTGIVRQADIDIGNEISSDLVANFQINVDGHGAEQSFTTHGWMGRVTNFVWPF